jgi:nitrite reductase/ring-hydroxylating ferredoxin subunit
MMDQFERFNELVDALLGERRLKRSRLSSADELEALQMAAALMARGRLRRSEPDFVAALHQGRRGTSSAGYGADLRPRIAATAFWLPCGEPRNRLAGWHWPRRWLLPRPAAARTQRRWPAPLVGDDGQWVQVASASAVASGTVQRFTAGAVTGYILNEDGQFRAVSASCTCMGCILAWNAEADEFVCPCHGATFDRAGAMVDESSLYPGTQLRRLPQIRVQVEEDTVMVWTIGQVEEPKPPPLPPIV